MDTFGAGLISINVGRAWRGRGGALGVCACGGGGDGGNSRLFGSDAALARLLGFSDFHLKKPPAFFPTHRTVSLGVGKAYIYVLI